MSTAKTRFVAATADPEIALVTIPGVELLEVGEDWVTSTGIFTFTEDDLASAVAAVDDPGVRTPVIKLGHTDPRFDGQPSLGRILNLRTNENQQTLIGDFVGVPAWLASVMASAYPRRSIEGLFGMTTRTGNTWDFALTGIALLGEAYPAIDTLEDIAALWGSTAPTLVPVEDITPMVASGDGAHFVAYRRTDMPQWQQVAAATPTDGAAGHTHMHSHAGGSMHSHLHVHSSGDYTHGAGSDTPHEHGHPSATAPETRPVRAAVSVEDLRRGYYDTLDSAQMWWWIREMRVDPAEIIVDDDEGALYTVSYTIASDGTIVFGDPVQVEIEYVPVAASLPLSADNQLVAARYATAVAAGRPARPPATAHDHPHGEGHTQPAAGAATLPTTTERENDVQLSEEVRQRLGLGPDATDEEVNAAIIAGMSEPEGSGGGSAGSGPTGAAGGEGAGEAQPPPATGTGSAEGEPAGGGTPAPPATPAVPDGLVLVDSAQWAEVQEGVAAARQMRDDAVTAGRNALLDEAVRAGKFPRSRREHYATLLASDPEGTTTLIGSMAPGLIPVTERGVAAGADAGDETKSKAYPKGWDRTVAASRNGGTSRIKVVRD